VEHPEKFLRELARVAARGYIEFPTVYYEYLYNFREHVNLVAYKEGELLWMPKRETALSKFDPIQQFLRTTLDTGYDDFIHTLKESFFQGFEWNASIRARRARDLSELIPSGVEVQARRKRPEPRPPVRIVGDVWRKFWRRIGKLQSS
jgi:hypothetical protein